MQLVYIIFTNIPSPIYNYFAFTPIQDKFGHYFHFVLVHGFITEYNIRVSILCIIRLGSLVSVRTLGEVDWVQSNLGYKYDSSHLVWVYSMALPLLFVVCIAIPTVSIASLKYTKGTRAFENLSFLHNEYNSKAYYWEGMKILQRELILLSMTLYLDFILIKGLLISIVLWGYT